MVCMKDYILVSVPQGKFFLYIYSSLPSFQFSKAQVFFLEMFLEESIVVVQENEKRFCKDKSTSSYFNIINDPRRKYAYFFCIFFKTMLLMDMHCLLSLSIMIQHRVFPTIAVGLFDGICITSNRKRLHGY